MTTTWHPPGAGEWKRDEAHLPSVMTGYLGAVLTPAQMKGFEAGFAHYGALIAGFDTYTLAGRIYMRPRIAGAPPQPIWGETPPAKSKAPGKPPPKLVMRILFALHPELRRRARRSALVWEQRTWREMTRRWFDEHRPAMRSTALELTRVDVSALDDAALATHLEAATAHVRAMAVQHFTQAAMPALVVGDFIVRVQAWTGATATEVLETLQGASPASRAGAVESARIAAALAGDASLRAIVESDRPAAEIVAALRADGGDTGRLVNSYLTEHGLRPITGLDIYHQMFDELPELLVRALRASLAGCEPPRDASADAAARLRARVPQGNRAAFDEAYSEARDCYRVRDDDVGMLLWAAGIMHRAVREAGRRLATAGRVRDHSHAWEATPDELPALLRGTSSTPSPTELATRSATRLELDALEPPVVLGEAGPMPDPESFPPAVARTQRAVLAFIAAMDGEPTERSTRSDTSTDSVDAAPILGTAVSDGVYEGRARVMNDAGDLGRIERGDILVARYTSPAYNVVLPLLGAIVTERGGLLSHAAIVAREYGIPAIVNTRDALARVPDGAIVRVDGRTGTVHIVRPPDGATTVAAGSRTEPARVTVTLDQARGPGRIVTLAEATHTEFGGKARALAAAVAATLPVPDGVALDADLVVRVVAGDPDARKRVQTAVARLAGPWAVRSSAVGEDSAQASFAGQHATLLGVQPGAVFDAIASVHASGHTEAARAYRAKMNIGGEPRMGVVIQTLLRPDISGVLFSRDPHAARDGRVIEATWGLGEALVSGLVTPDRYRVAADGEVLERAIGDKDLAIEAREDGGTAEVEIRGERVTAACLDDARLAELAELATRCEQLFGGPQDLEWAVANGRLHLLQSRPVTTVRL